jgi:uncharacterized protein YfbU (UPF0304 family)
MKLTQYQRQVLSNQHQILSMLQTDEHMSDYHEQMQEIYNDGFEYMYFEHGAYNDNEVLEEAECRDVFRIINMYDDLTYYWNNSDDLKENISEYAVIFPGFDLNDSIESKYYSFAKFLILKQNRFHDTGKMIREDINKLNSHGSGPGISGYLDILNRYEEVMANRSNTGVRNGMTLEEMKKILNR